MHTPAPAQQQPQLVTPAEDPPLTWTEVIKCGFPAFGGILFGYDAGYINGVLGMDYFKLTYGEPSTDPLAFQGHMYPTWAKSMIVSMLSVGTFLGALLSGYSSDYWGRRNTIVIGCAIYCAGVIFQIAGPTIPLLTAGRAIAGFGIGFVSANTVAFQSEICPKKIRGPCISVYQFGITLGLLIASGINQGTRDIRSNASYQIPIGLQFVFAVLLALGLMCLLPESPRWYLSKFNEAGARKALASVRGRDENDEVLLRELEVMRTDTDREMREGAGGWKDCFTGGWKEGSNLKRTFIGTTVQMMQQLSEFAFPPNSYSLDGAVWLGMSANNFIFYYGNTYFAQVGLSSVFLLATITNVVNVISTPVSFWTIERFGRRPLLIYGGICMSICEFIIAIVGTLLSSSHTAQIILFVFVCIHIAFFASTWGPVGWAVSGEIFPLSIRGRGIALSTASNWLWNFVIAFVTPYLVDEDKANLKAKVFYIFGATCLISAAFAWLWVYETKGLSLEAVDRMCKETAPRKSKGWAARNQPADDDEEEMMAVDQRESPSEKQEGRGRRRNRVEVTEE
ncbi:Major facilitator superfamily domain general substrate transporter protein [Rutstroemia sp. NJR-2017a BVV2]|nr:Major facilitator superfamily domain general substrate transporter protein [Rutstroemia sp. NJR-2017a BVV2]